MKPKYFFSCLKLQGVFDAEVPIAETISSILPLQIFYDSR